jgi:hypothetical protein
MAIISVKVAVRGAILLFAATALGLLRTPVCHAAQLLRAFINFSITASRVAAQEPLKPLQETASSAPILALTAPPSSRAQPASAAIF